MELLLHGWFAIASGVVVLALLPFGFARLSKEPNEDKRQQRLYSLIGLVWLGLSMLLDGVARFLPSRAEILSIIGLLLALVAVGFFLRGLTVKNSGASNGRAK